MNIVFRFTAFIILFTFVFSCENKNDGTCLYTISQLTSIDTPKVSIVYQNDTLIELRDSRINQSTGVYIFNKEGVLRSYSFLLDNKYHRFLEEYDSKGNYLKREGSPILEYRIWTRPNDTIEFNILIFALNKQFQDIEVITNTSDTIRPENLYPSESYTNVKAFPLKIKHTVKSQPIVLVTNIAFYNNCNKKMEHFSDTMSFSGIEAGKYAQ